MASSALARRAALSAAVAAVASGATAVPAATADPGGTPHGPAGRAEERGALPFTGTDAWLLAVAAAASLPAGVALRRAG
jgi:hypothetical protein